MAFRRQTAADRVCGAGPARVWPDGWLEGNGVPEGVELGDEPTGFPSQVQALVEQLASSSWYGFPVARMSRMMTIIA